MLEFGQHLGGIIAVGQELDFRAFTCGQHHQTHDALTIYLLFVLLYENVAFIFVGDANDHRGRSGVNAHFVLHDQFFDVLARGRSGFIHRLGGLVKAVNVCGGRVACNLKQRCHARLTMSKFAVIVPCRLESTRFPRKLLHLVRGKPLVLWVAERLAQVAPEWSVFFAVDDHLLFDCLKQAGFQAIMTGVQHPSGTDRIAEANRQIKADYVINVQADEPLVSRGQIESLATLIQGKAPMATLATPFKRVVDFYNPNQVKVVFDKNGRALYFSRSRMPFSRDLGLTIDDAWVQSNPCFKHLGLYAYHAELLEKFAKLPLGRLEQIEKLEQLRVIENGYDIMVGVTEDPTIGVDTLEDAKKFEAWLK